MNDNDLKSLLAKMLPETVKYDTFMSPPTLRWNHSVMVRDTELLHLCSLVEAGLEGYQRTEYTMELRKIVVREMDTPPHQDLDTGTLLDIYFYGATWQQRTTALASVKGVTL